MGLRFYDFNGYFSSRIGVFPVNERFKKIFRQLKSYGYPIDIPWMSGFLRAAVFAESAHIAEDGNRIRRKEP